MVEVGYRKWSFFFKALTGKIVVINTSVLLWAYGHGRWSLTRGGHARMEVGVYGLVKYT